MTKPLTQEEFDYYYSKTDPTEPKPVREIHAVRMAASDYIGKYGWDKYCEEANQTARDFCGRHNKPYQPVATLA